MVGARKSLEAEEESRKVYKYYGAQYDLLLLPQKSILLTHVCPKRNRLESPRARNLARSFRLRH